MSFLALYQLRIFAFFLGCHFEHFINCVFWHIKMPFYVHSIGECNLTSLYLLQEICHMGAAISNMVGLNEHGSLNRVIHSGCHI